MRCGAPNAQGLPDRASHVIDPRIAWLRRSGLSAERQTRTAQNAPPRRLRHKVTPLANLIDGALHPFLDGNPGLRATHVVGGDALSMALGAVCQFAMRPLSHVQPTSDCRGNWPFCR